MAAILAVAASDNWNQNASWVGGVQPTAADDVTIVAGANVTIPSSVTALARSVTIAATGTVTFAATTSLLNIGDATAGASNVAFSNSGTITLTANGVINFISTSTTQQTITTGSSTMPNLTFNGTGGTWTQNDALTTAGNITLTAGTWATGNFNVTASKVNLGNATARTFTPGSSVITISGDSAGWTMTSNTNLTWTANTATYVLTGNSTAWSGGTFSLNGGSVVMSPSGGGGSFALNVIATVANFVLVSGAIKTANFVFSQNITVTGTLALQGNSSTNRLLVQGGTNGNPVPGTVRTITVNGSTTASVTLAGTTYQTANVDLMDITGAGTASWDLTQAGAATATFGDCQGNSGITFTTPISSYYSRLTSGNWSASSWFAGTAQTGGLTRVPLPQDTAIVDGSNTTGITITADMPRLGKDINFTGFTGTASFSSTNVTSFGNWAFGSGMAVTGGLAISLWGRSSQTITSSGKVWPGGSHAIGVPNTPASVYTLQDAIDAGTNQGSIGTTNISGAINGQTFNTNGFTVTSWTCTPGQGSTWTMTNSTLVLKATTTVNIWAPQANTTINASGSTIVINSASTNTRTFAGLGKTYGTLQYTVANSPGPLVITSANTFANLYVTSTAGPKMLTLPASTITTVTGTASFAGTQTSGSVYLPGLSKSYVSTPSFTAANLSSDFTIDARVAPDTWTPSGSNQMLVSKWDGATQKSWQLILTTTGFLSLNLSIDGTTTLFTNSSVAIPGVTNGQPLWLRIIRVKSTGAVTFYTSPDGVTYTPFGTPQTLSAGNAVFAGTADIEIGADANGTVGNLSGKVYNVRIWTDTTQTTQIMSPDFTTTAQGTELSYTDTQGNVWTVNGAVNGLVYLNSSSGGSQATLNVLAPNAGLIKQIQLPFTGAVSFVGTMGGRAIAHVLAAAASFSGAITRATTHKLPAALSFTGSLAKRTSQTFLAGLVFVGSLASRIINTITLTASLGFSGTVSRKVFALLSGNLSFVGQTFKSTTKTAFTGSLSFVGNIFKKTVNVLAASLSFVGAFLAGTPIGVLLTASLRFSGSATKKTSRSLTGSLSFVGVLKHMFHVLLTAALAFSGSVSRFTKLSLTSNLSFLGFFRGVLPSIFKPISLILNSFSPTETLESQTNNAALSSETNTAGVESQTNIAVLSSGANTDIVNSDTNQVILKNNTLG